SNGIDGAGSNAIFFAPFRAALHGLPYLSPYNADGSVTTDGGLAYGDTSVLVPNTVPYVLLNSAHMNTDTEDEVKIIAGLSADWNFAKNLTAGMQLGMDYSNFQTLEILHPLSLLGPFQVDPAAEYGGIHAQGTSRDFRFNSLFSLNYNNTFAEKHTVDITGFIEYNKAHLEGFNFEQRGLDPRLLGTGQAFVDSGIFEDLDGNPNTPDTQPYIPTVGSTKASEGLFSYFGNLDYAYNSRYGITATVRRDASFRFTDDNRWGTFWSIGGRWLIDEESFMEGSKFNMLKLRA